MPIRAAERFLRLGLLDQSPTRTVRYRADERRIA